MQDARVHFVHSALDLEQNEHKVDSMLLYGHVNNVHHRVETL